MLANHHHHSRRRHRGLPRRELHNNNNDADDDECPHADVTFSSVIFYRISSCTRIGLQVCFSVSGGVRRIISGLNVLLMWEVIG
jgi:hypothetical protein